MIPAQTIGYLCLLAGLSMIVGWWVAFRNRPYLLSLGIFFAALAASLIISDRLQPGATSPALLWALRAVVAVAALAFVTAVVLAVQETRRRIQEIKEHYHAAAEALTEITRAKEQQLRQGQQKSEETSQDSSRQDGEG